MKDVSHHLKSVQKKVLQEFRRSSSKENQESKISTNNHNHHEMDEAYFVKMASETGNRKKR